MGELILPFIRSPGTEMIPPQPQLLATSSSRESFLQGHECGRASSSPAAREKGAGGGVSCLNSAQEQTVLVGSQVSHLEETDWENWPHSSAVRWHGCGADVLPTLAPHPGVKRAGKLS